MPGLEVWSRWSSVADGSSTPGGRVTAIPWGNNIALFLADPNGGIYTALGDPKAGFGPWRSVSEGSSTPGGSVTAIPWGNNIALFLADPNGGIYTALGDPNYAADHGNFAGFGPWRSVSEGGSTPGGSVTAIPWGNNIALFLADPNGGIYTALGDPNYAADHGNFAGFGPWRSVSEGGSTPGGSVTAIPWGNNIALFLADPNGGIYTALGDPNYAADHGNFAGFGPWRSVSEGGSKPGGSVTAIPWGNNIALFLADPNGGIYTALGDPNYAADHVDHGVNFAGFGAWRSVSEGSSTPGGSVTAIPWGNNIALFLADPNGGIYTALGDPNYAADHGNFAGFGPWAFVKDGITAPGARVVAVPSGKGLALFIADSKGAIEGGFILTTDGDPAQPIGPPHDKDADQAILEVQSDHQSWVPPHQPTDPEWALGGSGTYPFYRSFEWNQVLLAARTANLEYETVSSDASKSSLVGASGWVRGPSNSGADVPFSHPFGGLEHFPYGRIDWEFGILPDDQYTFLLSPANQVKTSGEPSEAPGTLGVECDQALIPASFRANVSDGDRVAIFGRWIMDQGHLYTIPDADPRNGYYRTEIHPPLLMATGSVQEDATGNQFTRVLFMSRPFLPSQTYTLDPKNAYNDAYKDPIKDDYINKETGGFLIPHMTNQVEAVARGDSSTIAAYGKIMQQPFLPGSSMRFEILIRPPPAVVQAQLVVSFQFTVRNGCSVQVESTSEGTINVSVSLNSTGYTPPRLPERKDRLYSLEELDLLHPGVASEIEAYVNTVPEEKCLFWHPRRNVLDALAGGIHSSEYARLPEIDVLDRGNAVSAIVSDTGPILAGQGVTVNDDQPYPIYGWFEAKWIVGPGPIPVGPRPSSGPTS